MTKARNMADLLDSNGDVKSGALDNVPPSNDASALTTGTLPVDRVPYLGRRNLIINGAMQVAQRGTSVTGLQNSPAFLVDRFSYRRGGAWSSFQATMTQSSISGVPGFSNSVKLSTTTAETNTSSSAAISTAIEGQDLAGLNWGTSDAKSITLSFWVKSNVTGSHQLWCSTISNTSNYYFTSYTISSADTWEYKTITISANLVQPTTTNTTGLDIYWQYSGKTSAAVSAQDTWVTDLGWSTLSGVADLATSTSNYLEITGVQLEVGTVATPFEHRSYGEELALCQRYYQKLLDQVNYRQYTYNVHRMPMRFVPSMRTAPTITAVGSVRGDDVGLEVFRNGQDGTSWTLGVSTISVNLSPGANGLIDNTLTFTADAEL